MRHIILDGLTFSISEDRLVDKLLEVTDAVEVFNIDAKVFEPDRTGRRRVIVVGAGDLSNDYVARAMLSEGPSILEPRWPMGDDDLLNIKSLAKLVEEELPKYVEVEPYYDKVEHKQDWQLNTKREQRRLMQSHKKPR